MLTVFLKISALFLIILLGILLRRGGWADATWDKVLNRYALHIGLPALIFSALSTMPLSVDEHGLLLVSNALFILVLFGLGWLSMRVFGLSPARGRTVFLGLVLANYAYLGIPLLGRVYGEAMIPTASLIVAVYLFFVFTLGLGYLEYQQHRRPSVLGVLRALIRNPLLVAVFLGVVVSSLSVPMPSVLMQSVNLIAGSVTPIVLIVIGLFLGNAQRGKLGDWIPATIFSVIILFGVPGLFFYGTLLFGFEPSAFAASIVQAAMPMGITAFALADEYQLDHDFIARCIVISTTLAIVSLPFWIQLLQ